MDITPSRINRDVTFRLIIDHHRDGRLNMAIDEALMEHAGAEDAAPIIRLYGFRPATLSVGRFQRARHVVDFQHLEESGVMFVRRPTGGSAVLHDQELTYSVALGRHMLGTLSKRQMYKFIVPLLLHGLEKLGVPQPHHVVGAQAGGENPDCFAATGEFEIDSHSGHKLIGSAQMVSRTAVLQHGSIPLTPANRMIYRFLLSNNQENQSTSVSEELNRDVGFNEAAAAFKLAIESILDTRTDGIHGSEMKRAEELLNERYSRADWNLKY